MYDFAMPRPSTKLDTLPRVEIQSRAQWRAWLQAHHATSGSIWLVNYKKSSGGPHVPYDDIVEEALCFGWVDGLVRSLDDRRGMALLSPRKPGSTWSKSNKARVERLIAAGLMTPAGLEKIERAKADGSWTVLDAAEALTLPDDLTAVLRKHKAAGANFAAWSASRRRGLIWWVTSAKRPETRARRIAETVRLAATNAPLDEFPGAPKKRKQKRTPVTQTRAAVAKSPPRGRKRPAR